MKQIIRVERNRVLNSRAFLVISIAILIFSVFSTINSMKNYNIYDSSGKVSISSRENLKESKLKKHDGVFNEEKLKEIVDRKDKSKYLYNFNLIRLITTNYKDKKVEEVTEGDIKNFYNQRNLNLKNSIKYNLIKYTDEEMNNLALRGEKLETPLKTGYAEGWKNLNNDMVDFVLIIVAVISIIVLPIFSQDQKTKMRELYISTQYGKKTLVKCRIIAGIEVGAIIYGVGVFIFSFSKLLAFGIRGFDLPIQNSINYFLSTYNITYLQQCLINVLIGFIAVMLVISITYVFSVLVNNILSGAVLVVFLWIIMIMVPKENFYIGHYFANFLPYKMTDFNYYYINNEVYTILGKTIHSATWVTIVCTIIFILLMISSMVISNIKLSSKLK